MIQFIDQSVTPLGLAPSTEPEMLKLIELAGRTAYKSEERITEDSALKFVTMLKKSGHLSVLEHSNIAFRGPFCEEDRLDDISLYKRSAYHPIVFGEDGILFGGNLRAWIETISAMEEGITWREWFSYGLSSHFPSLFHERKDWKGDGYVSPGLVSADEQLELLQADPETDLPVFIFKIVCDRGISHEIVRHRVLSFTQESTRYVNYAGKGMTCITPCEYDLSEHKHMFNDAFEYYKYLLHEGHKPQIARDVLPNLLKAELIVSGRWSGWKHFIELRDSNAAHPRIRPIARFIREYFEGLSLTV